MKTIGSAAADTIETSTAEPVQKRFFARLSYKDLPKITRGWTPYAAVLRVSVRTGFASPITRRHQPAGFFVSWPGISIKSRSSPVFTGSYNLCRPRP